MKVLIACEFSGKVRRAFARRDHKAVSCDLLPTELDPDMTGEQHYAGDIKDILYENWDALIAFPPCTHLAVSGARWWPNKQTEQQSAISFVKLLYDSGIPKWP